MSMVEDTRVNVPVPFPTLVQSSGPVIVSKKNGIWSIGLSVAGIPPQTPPPGSLATDYVLVWDSVAQTWITVPLSALGGSGGGIGEAPNDGQQYGRQSLGWTVITGGGGGGPPAPVFDTAAGTYNVTTEQVLLVNKTVPAANNVQLPAASGRGGVAIVVKDYAGNAATFAISILPNGAERIDGLATLPINSNYGGFKLVPISTGGWYISP
jgi:hypothetical protein